MSQEKNLNQIKAPKLPSPIISKTFRIEDIDIRTIPIQMAAMDAGMK
jgi:hypothetical protein